MHVSGPIYLLVGWHLPLKLIVIDLVGQTARCSQRRDWQCKLFPDESQYYLFHTDGRVGIYHRIQERQPSNHVQLVHRQGGGYLIVRGGICGDRNTELFVLRGIINVQHYVYEVL